MVIFFFLKWVTKAKSHPYCIYQRCPEIMVTRIKMLATTVHIKKKKIDGASVVTAILIFVTVPEDTSGICSDIILWVTPLIHSTSSMNP